ncbi:MAG: tetratricopeptide repeat protein [Acetobacter sp.]|nr:tetratricopeptide repeat protein [Acetobacter sp.]
MDMPPPSNKPNYNFWIIKLGKALALKQYESALFCAEEALDVAQTETERAEAMNFKGDCLIALQRYEEALQIYNNSIAKFQNDCKREAEPFLKEHIAKAFFQKMETLSKLKRQAEISSVYDEMVCRFGDDNTLFIRKYLAKALFEKARYFGHLAEKENSLAAYALALYDELLQKFSNETDTEIKQYVSGAMFCKGAALSNLERYDDAIKAYDACIEKFSNETDTEIQKIVKEAREERDKLR